MIIQRSSRVRAFCAATVMLVAGGCRFCQPRSSTPPPGEIARPGPAAKTKVGAACTTNEECSAGSLRGECVTAAEAQSQGFSAPGGYCTAVGCDPSVPASACGPGAVCRQFAGSTVGACYAACTSGADCRQGYSCGGGICRPVRICSPPGAACTGQADCCAGAACENNLCSPLVRDAGPAPAPGDGGSTGPTPGCSPGGCGVGFWCNGGTCQPGCNDPTDPCPSGDYCVEGGHYCASSLVPCPVWSPPCPPYQPPCPISTSPPCPVQQPPPPPCSLPEPPPCSAPSPPCPISTPPPCPVPSPPCPTPSPPCPFPSPPCPVASPPCPFPSPPCPTPSPPCPTCPVPCGFDCDTCELRHPPRH